MRLLTLTRQLAQRQPGTAKSSRICYGFSTTAQAKDFVGKAHAAAETVNKKVGQVAAKGLEGVENAAQRVKRAGGSISEQAQNVSHDAKQELGKVKHSAKELAQDAKNKIRA
ncbi:hypothetical protein O181_020322 [Austropuccinia psidii MF-1]|uniref:Uncharacterized protein n=1 Tax=Austropuccinia psidii MF-1 TaxID=1389203 RepID=A0A9Q3CBG3_9BASI|nr:hypothetical protein [Austropuccinia psidii MF-1]